MTESHETDAGSQEQATDAVESTDQPQGSADAATKLLYEEADVAADYVEKLLDLMDLDGEFDMVGAENGRAVVTVVDGPRLSTLVGKRGRTLEALQELTRRAVERETGERSRLMLDIDGYREGRRRELAELGTSTAKRVVADGVAVTLEPMTPFERKMVHDAVAAVDGASSGSVGEEPERSVVVRPAEGPA